MQAQRGRVADTLDGAIYAGHTHKKGPVGLTDPTFTVYGNVFSCDDDR
jgi:hypothetical protein